jgi:hypothetical protein
MKTSKIWHYYLSYKPGHFPENTDPSIVLEKFDPWVLDAFVCSFSGNLVFHFYCTSSDAYVVRRYLISKFGNSYDMFRSGYKTYKRHKTIENTEQSKAILAKMEKVESANQEKSKQISLLPCV